MLADDAHFLGKPFTVQTLAAKVQEVLNCQSNSWAWCDAGSVRRTGQSVTFAPEPPAGPVRRTLGEFRRTRSAVIQLWGAQGRPPGTVHKHSIAPASAAQCRDVVRSRPEADPAVGAADCTGCSIALYSLLPTQAANSPAIGRACKIPFTNSSSGDAWHAFHPCLLERACN